LPQVGRPPEELTDAFKQTAKQTVKQTAKRRSQNPTGIGEIRNQIYRDILQAVPSDGDFHATIITLDSDGDLIENDIDANETKVLDVVPKSGVAKVFKLGLAQLQQLFTEFLSENAPDMTFQFTHSGSLSNFAELLRAYLTTPEGTRPVPVTVAISLFSHRKKFAKMAGWQKTDMAHGYKEKAEEHVKEWMEAVQTLPSSVKLILHLDQPWFDYRSLRGVTACLRSPDAVCTTDVAVTKSAWEVIPDMDFHLKMTVASIKGVEVPFPEVDVEELLKHGCRGFRGRV
jgi:hypothetical protein